MDELSLKLIYDGENSLRKFVYIIGKSGIELKGVGFEVNGRDCANFWNGWIKIEDRITALKDVCPICFLGDITYILKDKENIPIEIYLALNR